MSPAVLQIAVGDYLRFEVSHSISLGSGYTIWKVSQYNGPAEPMTMVVQGDRSHWRVYILQHILAEIANYGPPAGAADSEHINVRTYVDKQLTYEGLCTVSRKNDKLDSHELLNRFISLFDLFPYMSRDAHF